MQALDCTAHPWPELRFMRSRSWASKLRLALLILLMAPIWLVMIFTGFPPPLPPGQRRRPAQTQSQPWKQQRELRSVSAALQNLQATADPTPHNTRDPT